MTDVRIAAASEIGGAARLEGAWLQAFGAGDRAPGWFARKLVRDRVSDQLSRVAIASGEDPRSPRSWRGFVLAGRLPSLHGVVRTAGTAVLPHARGRGIGRALLDALVAAAAEASATSIQLVADASTILYYERLQFVRVRDVATLQLHASGPARRLPAPLPWDAAIEGLAAPRSLSSWTPEAWEGAGPHGAHQDHPSGLDRATVDLPGGLGRVLVSREGEAWLVHRFLAAKDVSLRTAMLALARALPGPAPVVIPHVAPMEVSSITGGDEAVARVIQRGALLHRLATSALHPPSTRR